MATGFLMYHELEQAGRPLAETDPGYVLYVLRDATFAQQLAWIAAHGSRGASVSQALAAALDSEGQVAITFDDGCETDWTIAAPRLLEHGFGATFYVVSRWIGRRPGFMSVSQLRELAAAGFEIGSHSATHAFLTDLRGEALRGEIVDSKREIEDLLGAPVRHFSCPGGRWNRAVADVARDAGYDTVATSRIGANTGRANPYALSRCPMQRDTPQVTFEAFCRGNGLARLQLRERTLAAAKAVLGNRVYTTLRSAALRQP